VPEAQTKKLDWTMERLEDLRRSGDWFADEHWRDPAYVANSPFTPADLDGIFDALQRTYTPARARRVAKRERSSGRTMPRHRPPLFDPWAAHASFAVSVGADLAEVRPWETPGCGDMVNGLVKDPENYPGARLELEVHAALLRAGVEVERGDKIDRSPSAGKPRFRISRAGARRSSRPRSAWATTPACWP